METLSKDSQKAEMHREVTEIWPLSRASKAASKRVGDYYSFPGEGWIYVCRMRFVFSLRRMAYGVKCHVVNGSKH